MSILCLFSFFCIFSSGNAKHPMFVQMDDHDRSLFDSSIENVWSHKRVHSRQTSRGQMDHFKVNFLLTMSDFPFPGFSKSSHDYWSSLSMYMGIHIIEYIYVCHEPDIYLKQKKCPLFLIAQLCPFMKTPVGSCPTGASWTNKRRGKPRCFDP